MDPMVFLNGEYLLQSQAKVSVMDRGFLFGEAVYEVIPVYAGQPFCLDEHLERLTYSLGALEIEHCWPREKWQEIFTYLIAKAPPAEQLSLYIQVTGGCGQRRQFQRDKAATPGVFVSCLPSSFQPCDAGVKAITVPEMRWQRCDIKSTNLLATLFMQRMAQAAGAKEAIIIDANGELVEAATSSVCMVEGGEIITRPLSHHLLGSVTRAWVKRLALQQAVTWREEPMSLARLLAADEVWLLASSKQITPVICVDQQAIGAGVPGPLWRKMIDAYRAALCPL